MISWSTKNVETRPPVSAHGTVKAGPGYIMFAGLLASVSRLRQSMIERLSFLHLHSDDVHSWSISS